jgi:dihydroorotate dehydrogenase
MRHGYAAGAGGQSAPAHLPAERRSLGDQSLGFNNKGLDAFAIGLAARAGKPGIVGANVGANKESADRAADYVLGMGRVWKHASYVTANISSPNTPGLRGLQERGALEDLLGRLREARRAAGGRAWKAAAVLEGRAGSR